MPLAGWGMRWSILVAASLLPPATAAAQLVHVAALSEVRGLTTGDACKALPTPGIRSALSRLRGRESGATWPADSVFAKDGLTVQPRTDVRVTVAPRLGTGTIYLTPDLGTCPTSEKALRDRGLPTPDGAASYRFDRESVDGGGEQLVLTVDHGSTIIEWDRGHLVVYAGARRLEVKGTRFVVIVDSTTNTAAVYVLEGAVAMSGPDGMTASQGETLVFRAAGAAKVPSPDVAFVNDIRHKSRTVWGIREGGASRLPWIVGGALVAAGVTVAVWPDRLRAVATRISIRIPF
jgi:hypothetical protein